MARGPLKTTERPGGLSLAFATCCIVDLFGVFPIIALPRAIVDCGWYGIPLALTVFCLQIYTAVLLGKCWIIAERLEPDISRWHRSPYAALGHLAYGSTIAKYITVILNLAIFGAGVPNILIAAQNLQVIGLKMSDYEMDFSYCYWMIIIGIFLCPLMWLGSPKDMKWIAVTSVLTVLAASIFTWICLYTTEPWRPPTIPSPSWESFAVAYGILAFQFDVHPMILTVQIDMKNKNQLGEAIIYGFLASGGMFLVTAILVYTGLGDQVGYNTLAGLRGSSILYAAVILVTIQIILSMVVGTSPLYQSIEQRLGINPSFNWKRCLIRSGLIIGAVGIAEAVPRVDLIMGLLGAALTGQLMFVFPPLIYTRLRWLDARRARDEERRAGTTRYYGAVVEPNGAGCSASSAIVLGLSPRDATTFEDNLPVHGRAELLSMVRRRDASRTPGPWHKALHGLLLTAGLLATVISTCVSLDATLKYGRFLPSCVLNATISSRIVAVS